MSNESFEITQMILLYDMDFFNGLKSILGFF